MTTPPFSREFESSDDQAQSWASRESEHLSEPGELIAAIPALMGFSPEDSVVALCLMGTTPKTLGPIMRHDYFPNIGSELAPAMRSALEQFVRVCATEGTVAVILVMIGDHPLGELFDIAAEFNDMLTGNCVELVDVFAVPVIARGRDWMSILAPDRYGRLPDPGSSSVAAAQVLGGRVIRASRSELVRSVRGQSSNHATIGSLIDQGRAQIASARCEAHCSNDPFAQVRREVEEVLAFVERMRRGVFPDPRECAHLALVLSDVRVRDTVMGLAATEYADAAEALWTILTHELPVPECSYPATLLGFFAYARGDGPLAGIALAYALEADPEYSLAGLLDNSLQAGMRPDGIRRLAEVGLDLARDFDVSAMPEAR
ncbi:DUF4192 domain-containing protein [Rhodococcus sp. 24CO]|uniref:DUF4192 domain-containing protein n=1 Tax=Rhodococcus sp. 24CO TaxID=3117460 RepID=UPI003D34D8E8